MKINELFHKDVSVLIDSAADQTTISLEDFLSARDIADAYQLSSNGEFIAALLASFDAISSGNLCLSCGIAYEGVFRDKLADFQSTLENDCHKDKYGSAVAVLNSIDDELPKSPLVYIQDGEAKWLYFQKYLAAAKRIRDYFSKCKYCMPSIEDIQLYADVISKVQGIADTNLTPDQWSAVSLALINPFSIITGGPGTGKTTIIRTILSCLSKLGFGSNDILLAAPTGRAAGRMTESISAIPEFSSITANTVHKLLGANPSTGTFYRGPENPLPEKVLIVDEVSMLDAPLAGQLLSAVKEDMKVIFVGDADQLPSVNPGAVLAHFVPSEVFYSQQTCDTVRSICGVELPVGNSCMDFIARLTQNHRANTTKIVETASAINRGDENAMDNFELLTDINQAYAGCFKISGQRSSDTALQWIRRFVPNYKTALRQVTNDLDFRYIEGKKESLDKLFEQLLSFRVLTVMREGSCGCDSINSKAITEFKRTLDNHARANIFSGMPVMIKVNDQTRGLANGDIGIILRDNSHNWRAVFPSAKGYSHWAAEALPAYEPAFATTVHKSQGSEYKNVLVVVDTNEHGKRLLTREILYTAITRAKETAVLAGTEDALTAALRNRTIRTMGVSLY